MSAQKESQRTVQSAERENFTASCTKRSSVGKRRMKKDLERMTHAREEEQLLKREIRMKEVSEALAALHERKRQEGVTLTPEVKSSRAAIATIMRAEERLALGKEQEALQKETDKIRREVDQKYGLPRHKKYPDLLTLTERFYHDNVPEDDGIPEEVRRELTGEEIKDLKMVFDMFDVKGRGYITASDVKRAAAMLGFKAKKKVFKEMIEEISDDKKRRVTFVNFLQLVVKGQGPGPDPFEEILQCFRMLDTDQKGYITADDIRVAADTQKIPLSSRAIREMVEEADVTGDRRVTQDEFLHIMLQCSLFRTVLQ